MARTGPQPRRKTRNQRRKQPVGKPFTKGDPRINRTKAGPGRPPLAYRQALKSMEPQALQTVQSVLRMAPPAVRLRAAQDVLDRLHGKPKQPIDADITGGLADLLALAFGKEAPEPVG